MANPNGLQTINKTSEMAFDGIVLPCDVTSGLKCDFDNPTYGWKDMTGQIIPRSGGGAAPAFTAFRGGRVKNYAFTVGDVIDNITYHIPHDYVPNSDLYIHIHWKHNGTAISGTFAGNIYATYCKGYTQSGEIYHVEKVIPWSIPTPDITTYPRWAHNIAEIPFSISGGSAIRLDTDKIQTDGLIEIAFDITAKPTITGSVSSNLPYIPTIDIHYQSTEMATKNRNFPFYGV